MAAAATRLEGRSATAFASDRQAGTMAKACLTSAILPMPNHIGLQQLQLQTEVLQCAVDAGSNTQPQTLGGTQLDHELELR